MALPKHILVIRLSAPGDVAMTLPVLHSFQKAYPLVKLSILTNEKLAPLFYGLNAALFFAETKTEHKGFFGLLKLFSQLNVATKTLPVDAVIDLHNVLRSKIIRQLYKFKGIRTAFIDKGRKEKKEITRRENKVIQQLPTSFERYKKVFYDMGFHFSFHFHSIFPQGLPTLSTAILSITGEKKNKWIGIAPFAAYQEKTYPLKKMEDVVVQLCDRNDVKIIFFGGASDAAVLQQWQEKYIDSISVAGKLSLAHELALMSHLSVMLSMDSANMHFASLVNVPVVSIWGATHPYAGFLGWSQRMENAIQVDVFCRPCSIFGNKMCYRGDRACMNTISTSEVIAKMNVLLLA